MVARVVAPHGAADRCPGAVHAIAADDGALVRVRVPGGYLGAEGLATLAQLAETFGDGALDITARANVQLRGLRAGDLDEVARTLSTHGLLPSRAHERVRNIASNPFAGVDSEETIDVRPFVAAFDRALVTEPTLVDLPAKVLFGFDGGGRGARIDGADIAARAIASDGAAGAPRFEVTVAGDARRWIVAADRVVSAMISLAGNAVVRARALRLEAGTWRFTTLQSDGDSGPRELAADVVQNTSGGVVFASGMDVRTGRTAETVWLRRAVFADAPLGISETRDVRFVNLVPAIPLGRLHAPAARALAILARDTGADVRLGPWRGIVIGAYPRVALARAYDALRACGLALDDRDGFDGVAACAGRGACDAALADVRADAATYAALVAADDSEPGERGATPSTAWRVNFAGCEKRCAMRRAADSELVATANGYDVWVRGECVAVAQRASAAVALVRAGRADVRARTNAREHGIG